LGGGRHGTGRPLTQRLLVSGERVLDVPAKLAARARVFDTGQGRKTDPTDACGVAMRAASPTLDPAPARTEIGAYQEDGQVCRLVRVHSQSAAGPDREASFLMRAGTNYAGITHGGWLIWQITRLR
jgi:hypothetical protein